jgi:hypothetical protein
VLRLALEARVEVLGNGSRRITMGTGRRCVDLARARMPILVPPHQALAACQAMVVESLNPVHALARIVVNHALGMIVPLHAMVKFVGLLAVLEERPAWVLRVSVARWRGAAALPVAPQVKPAMRADVSRWTTAHWEGGAEKVVCAALLVKSV